MNCNWLMNLFDARMMSWTWHAPLSIFFRFLVPTYLLIFSLSREASAQKTFYATSNASHNSQTLNFSFYGLPKGAISQPEVTIYWQGLQVGYWETFQCGSNCTAWGYFGSCVAWTPVYCQRFVSTSAYLAIDGVSYPMTQQSAGCSPVTVTDSYIPQSAVADGNINIFISGNLNFDPCYYAYAVLRYTYRDEQEITFDSLGMKKYGDAPFVLNATSTSGLPVSFTSSNPTIASISGNTVSILKAGTVIINAIQVGNANYNPARVVQQVLTVNKAPLTASANNKSKTYGDENPNLTISYSGFVRGDTALKIAPDISTAASQYSNVGSYPITLSGGSDANYSLTLQNGSLQINQAPLIVQADSKNIVYGDSVKLTVTYSGFKGADDASVLDYPIVPSLNVADAAAKMQLIEVAKEKVAVSTDTTGTAAKPAPIAEAAAVKVADATAPQTDVKQQIAPAESKQPIETATYPNVGTYRIALQSAGDNNYILSLVPGTLTIQKAQLSVTPGSYEKEYGAPNPPFALSFSGFKGNDNAAAIDSLPRINALATQFSNRGIYTIDLIGGIDNNYELSKNQGTLIVNQASLVVTAENKSKTYGSNNPDLTFGFTGFKGADDASVLDSLPKISTQAQQFSNAGSYPIVMAGGGDNNYSLTLINGALSINKAPLKVAAVNKTSQYGEQFPEFTISYSGFVGNDDVGVLDVLPQTFPLTMPDSAFTSPSNVDPASISQFKEVGSYTIAVHNGADNNYEFLYGNGTLTITQAPLTITAQNGTRLLGEPNAPVVLLYAGLKGTETQAVIDSPPIATIIGGDAPGVYPIKLTGGLDRNYAIKLIDGTLTVVDPHVSKSYVISPADGSVAQEIKLTVTSLEVPNASSYIIQMSSRPDFSTDVQTKTGLRTQTFSMLEYNTVYYVHAKTNLDSLFGKTTTLTTVGPEYYSYITSPANETREVDLSVKISANAVLRALTYTIELNTSADFTGTSFTLTGGRNLTFSPLKPSTTYYCRMKTDLSDNWGRVSSFTTRSAESLSFVTSPDDGATDVNTKLNITSNEVPGASTYTIQLSESSDFSTVVFSSSSPDRKITFNGLKSQTLYYNRVFTDLASSPGRIQKFMTKATKSKNNAREVSSVEEPAENRDDIVVTSYPNPFREKLTIHVQTIEQQPMQVQLVNTVGSEIHRSNQVTNVTFEINEPLPSGVYIVNVITSKGSKAIRVTKLD